MPEVTSVPSKPSAHRVMPSPAACHGGVVSAQQRVVAALLLGCIGAAAILLSYRGFDPSVTDFRMFYSAAQMVRHGAAHRLYDLDAQHEFQRQYAGRVGLIFDYPPATALLYVPGTWLPIRAAYLLWTSFSVGVLCAIAVLLNSRLAIFRHSAALLFLILLFVPVWQNLMNGQIALIVVLAYALAFCFLDSGREIEAGAALALGLFKFHLILPFLFVLLLRKRWRVLLGFGAVSPVFLALCITTSGWRFFADYARMLLQLPSLPLTGMHLAAMANLHGLYVGFIGHEPSLWLIGTLSLALLLWSASMWHDAQIGFAVTLVVTVLVSYHLNPHDLCLLIVPAAILIKRIRLWSWRTVALLLLAPPLPFYLLGARFWMLGIAVIFLLITLAVPAKPIRTAAAPSTAIP